MQYWSKELWVVDICTSYSRRLHNIWIDSRLSDLLQSELKMKVLEVEGHVPQCPIAGDATVPIYLRFNLQDIVLLWCFFMLATIAFTT